jgi:beta-glucosidase
LLKNNYVLPLDKKIKVIAAFGNTSYNFISGGTGSGDVNEAYTVSLVEGMEKAGYSFLAPLEQQYRAHIKAEDAKRPPKKVFFELQAPLPELKPTREELLSAALQSDVAIVTIGRNSGEFQDRKKDNDFDLTSDEKQLIADVSDVFKARGKKAIVVLNIGGVIETVTWSKKPDAIVLAWQGGQEAGNALADVLTGKVNPSGKLPMTFPVKYEDVPSSSNFPGKELSDKDVKGLFGMSMGKPSEVVYQEGIYVGYRYYDVYKIRVAYPFGFGLSYTTFDYGKLKIEKQDGKGHLTVSLEIMNIGRLAGREVVQLYVAAPAKNLDKPSDELRAFAKTKLLKPGESQVLRFELAPKDLASFYTDRSAWIADAGLYTISANASAIDFKQLKTFTLNDEVVVEKCNKVLVPQVEINEWKSKR